MRGEAIALALGVWLAACHERPPSTQGPDAAAVERVPWPELPHEGFAVLPGGTLVYLQPSVAGPVTRLGWFDEASEPWPSGGIVVSVVGQRDGMVEIAPLRYPHPFHCERVLEGEAYDVRLYVSPWSLTPVITREHSWTFEDGTSIELRPGAPVRRIPDDPDGRWAVAVDDLRMRLEIPEDAVGLAYPEAQPITGPSGRSWLPGAGEPLLSFDEGEPLWVRSRFGSSEILVLGSGPWGDGFRVQLGGSCVEATVLADRLPPGNDREFVHFDFGLGGPEPSMLPPGGAALDVAALLEPEPEPPPPPAQGTGSEPGFVEPEIGFSEDELLEGELLSPGFLGLLGDLGGTLVFEEGAPVYYSGAGPAAGILRDVEALRDGWVMGDRLCFATVFGTHFQPILPVCFDGAEARLQTPESAPHDLGGSVAIPGEVELRGKLPRDAVEVVLRRHRHELRRCFDEAQVRQRPAPSSVELRLVLEVDGEGRVTAVRRDAGDLGMAVDCAIEAAKRWRLPATGDGEPGRVMLALRLAQQR
ncbi:MAG: hypothetical protein H6712_25175 [Myxococcales bacterium]|nr:hypothetical protein [Myxococcales bacterium]